MNDRKTIYCKDEKVWERVVQSAEEGGISVSQLLLAPFQKSTTMQVGLGQINRIEGKIDTILGGTIPQLPGPNIKRGTPLYGDGVSKVEVDLVELKKSGRLMVRSTARLKSASEVPFNPQPKKSGSK